MKLELKIINSILILVIVFMAVCITVLGVECKNLSDKLEGCKAQVEELEAREIEIESKDLGEHILTFYTHTGNRTASGVYPKAGRTVAVDTRYIPHGSILYIEGIGIRIAEDTGGDIKGKRLDVFVDTKEEAIKKGVKKAKVRVLKEAK